jgi:hypothetical protein
MRMSIHAFAVAAFVLASACSRRDETVSDLVTVEQSRTSAAVTTAIARERYAYVVPPIMEHSSGRYEPMDNFRHRLELYALANWEKVDLAALASRPAPVPGPKSGPTRTTGPAGASGAASRGARPVPGTTARPQPDPSGPGAVDPRRQQFDPRKLGLNQQDLDALRERLKRYVEERQRQETGKQQEAGK